MSKTVWLGQRGEKYEGAGWTLVFATHKAALKWLEEEHARIAKDGFLGTPTPIEVNSFECGCDWWQIREQEIIR